MEPTSQEIPKTTRREILKTGAALGLTACNLLPRNITEASNGTSEINTPSTTIITEGALPSEYSQLIINNDLQPRVLSAETSPESRLSQAISYLIRYSETLNNPLLPKLDLNNFAVSENNYPIKLPDQENLSIKTIVKELVSDYLNGKIQLLFKPEFKGLAGTIGLPKYATNNQWVFDRAEIWFGPYMNMFNDLIESTDLKYTQMTDAELATILMHEYGHVLQIKKLTDNLNYLSGEEKSRILKGEIQASQKIDELAHKNNIEIINKHHLPINVHTNEAQANALMEFFLYDLNKLNGSEHMPGTVFVDPTPAHTELYNWENLQTLFKDTILQSPEGALDNKWLREASI